MTARLLLVLPVIALLAACTTGAPGSPDTDNGGGSSDGGGSTAAGDCSEFGEEFAPFSGDLIASQSGDTWGDGTPFEIQLTDEAIAAEILPQVEFLSIVNGGPQSAANQIFDENGDGSFSNANNLFDSQFNNQPGIAQVFAITDATFDGEKYDGSTLILGNYCVTLKAG
jgi:hypothetical protein